MHASEANPMRAFGLKVARASGRLAGGLAFATLALVVVFPSLTPLWLGQLLVGGGAAPLVMKCYETGDEKYALAYGAVLGLNVIWLPWVLSESLGSPGIMAGVIAFMAGVAIVLAAYRRALIDTLEGEPKEI